MVRKTARRGETTTLGTYRDDPLYPQIERAVAAILARGKTVAPVDVLVGMDLLAPGQLEEWRRGHVFYLETVINCNLTRLSRLLRVLRFHAHDLNLVRSVTTYMCRGRGGAKAAALHQDRRPQARAGLCSTLRVAGRGSVPPACARGGS